MLVGIGNSLSALVSSRSIPSELIPAEALARLSAIAPALPRAADAFGFESRLAAGDATVDLGARVGVESGGAEALARFAEAEDLSAAFADAPAWRRLAAFCTEWSNPSSALYGRVPYLFLEFDVRDPLPRITAPGVFLHLEEARRARRDGAATEEPAWIWNRALPLLTGRAPSQPVIECLARSIRALPPEGRVIHVAVMAPRREDGVRIHASLPTRSAGSYLTSIGWPGFPDEIERICRRYGTTTYGAVKDVTEVQFDVTTSLGPRVGVEFSSRLLSSQERARDWEWLLDLLVEDGLCSKAKRDAVLAWPRTFQEKLAPTSWPCTFVQELSHVKIVVEPEKPLEAKVYLTVTPRFSLFKEERAAG